jgi:hypothetical protein
MLNKEEKSGYLTEEECVDLESLASMGWNAAACARHFRIAESDFLYELENGDDGPGTIRFHFENGRVRIQAMRDIAESNSLASGNVTAIQLYDKRKELADLKKFKEDVLNGNR